MNDIDEEQNAERELRKRLTRFVDEDKVEGAASVMKLGAAFAQLSATIVANNPTMQALGMVKPEVALMVVEGRALTMYLLAAYRHPEWLQAISPDLMEALGIWHPEDDVEACLKAIVSWHPVHAVVDRQPDDQPDDLDN